MFTVAVTEAIEIVILDVVPDRARLNALRSIAYSAPAPMLMVLSVVQPEALDPVQNVTAAAGTLGNTLVTVPAVADAAVVQLRASVATQAAEQ